MTNEHSLQANSASREQNRRAIKRLRTKLSQTEIAIASEKIAKNFWNLQASHRAKRIGIYLSAFGEVDCDAIARRAWLRKMRIFSPVLAKNSLFFLPYECDSVLTKNKYGILEPVHPDAPVSATRSLDIVVVPLVAFDSACNRLGMGAGYYDRCFGFRNRRKNWHKPLLVGVAYDFQRVGPIQAQPWDVPLDFVITESEVFQR